MICQAWTVHKPVLFHCLATVAVLVLLNLTELFVVPVILEKVELTVPLSEIIRTILIFSGLLLILSGAKAYAEQNKLFGRVKVRMNIIFLIQQKFLTTSYSNLNNPAFLQKSVKAQHNVGGNAESTEAIWDTLIELLKNLCGFVIYLLLLSDLNRFLFLVILVTSAAGYLVNRRVNEWAYGLRDEEASYQQKLRYLRSVEEAPSYAKDIRIFGMRSWLEDLQKGTMQLYEAFLFRRGKRYILVSAADVLLAFLRNGIAYLYLISLTLNNDLPASSFLLYFTAVSEFSGWVTGILNNLSTLHSHSLGINIIREFLEWPEPFSFETGKPLVPNPNGQYPLELRNVSFRYEGSDRDIIHDMNLTIRPGEKLAIVGLNGAGKTTLVKLLCGFFDPTAGTVLLNGEDIRQYNRADYYALFSAVFQQFSILDTSVAENVAQTVNGSPSGNMDMQKVRSCIEKAGLTEKIISLKHGYDTQLGREIYDDGVELSGGETQRLMLARALYKDAPVIVLDEPTAALDPIAENDIYQKYNELTAGRTSLFISHRLASTRFCDRILLLANGSVLEEGTHEELMKLNGSYAQLYQVQSKYYQTGTQTTDTAEKGV